MGPLWKRNNRTESSVEDVDRPRRDHDEQEQAGGRLDQHQHLCPLGERHRVRRAEGGSRL